MIIVHDMIQKVNVSPRVLLDFINHQILLVKNVHKAVLNVTVKSNVLYVLVVSTLIMVNVWGNVL